jgi:hypothetical protein
MQIFSFLNIDISVKSLILLVKWWFSLAFKSTETVCLSRKPQSLSLFACSSFAPTTTNRKTTIFQILQKYHPSELFPDRHY